MSNPTAQNTELINRVFQEMVEGIPKLGTDWAKSRRQTKIDKIDLTVYW